MSSVNITEDGGVSKRVIIEGHGERPPPHSRVVVHYVGKLEDGTVFDSSRGRGSPFEVHETY